MPTKRRRRSRQAFEDVKPGVIFHLLTGDWPGRGVEGCLDAFVLGDADYKALWSAHGEALLADWIKEHPGTRPWAWWKYSAPEPRPCLSGDSDVLQWHGNRAYGNPPEAPADPLTYESEAAFLRRHRLLTDAERRRLQAEDFEPEVITFDDGEAA